MNRKLLVGLILMGALLGACVPAPCTTQNNNKFIAEVKEIGYAYDAAEFNIAYTPQAKAEKLAQIRAQAQNVGAPGCAQYVKDLLLQSLDERAKNIGNPSNGPRPVSATFQAEFEAFQKATIAQLTNIASDPSNSVPMLQILFLLVGLMVVLLLGFGGYFMFRSEPRHKNAR